MKKKESNKTTKNSTAHFCIAPLVNPFKFRILELSSYTQTTWWFFMHDRMLITAIPSTLGGFISLHITHMRRHIQ